MYILITKNIFTLISITIETIRSFLLEIILISLFVWHTMLHLGVAFGHKAHGKKHIRAPFICCYHPLPKNIFQIVQYYSKCFQARGCPNSIDHRRGFWIWFFGNVWHKEVLCTFSRISSCRDWESTNVKCWFIRSTKISIRNTLTYLGILKLT